ncbi:MAG: murein biosynthesis integral membrane protein MurJ [Methylovirgula sp.]|jgi:putative peptidoglycan lipid II flippase
MYRNLFSVAAFTLLSRLTGFLRDVMLGAVLGAGQLADAFVVAFRLPNHFRAIFGEGAFNAAYVPCYTQVLARQGETAGWRFSSQIFTLLFYSQLLLLVLALIFMPEFIDLLAPGFRADPVKFSAAVTLTRITFPYLLFVTLVTLQSGTLNARGYFSAAAFAPVLLNLVMIGFMALAFLFPNAAYAAAVGVTVSGLCQFALTYAALREDGLHEQLMGISWTKEIRHFFAVLGPAVIGSAGVQLALFADTIIGSMLPTGGVSSIYYADRIYQLPIGIIGIAAGTVLLPEMSRRFALGDHGGAFHAQNRTMALSIVLGAPFFVAFIMIPEVIMRGVFLRGAFTEGAADASARVLTAYGFGLIAIVLIRSVVASFQSIGDTRTPMMVSLFSVAVNICFKVVLFKPFGAEGLALATALGAWLNFILLCFFALRRDLLWPDDLLAKSAGSAAIAAFVLSLFALFFTLPAAEFAFGVGHFENEIELIFLVCGGGLVYTIVLGLGFLISGVRLGRAPEGY